jgi:hypothetical protein
MGNFTGDEMENPYTPRNPVKDPQMFFGRKTIMEGILKDIYRKQMQSQCIIGERRIGKTSLLYQIMNKSVGEAYRNKSDPLIFIRTDMNFFPASSPEDILKEWITDITAILEYHKSVGSGYLHFKRFIDEINDSGYKIAILLDEFEAIIKNPYINRDFFEYLRALTQNYNVAFILFSRTPLEYFLRNKKYISIFSSPFFSILNVSYLSFLKVEDAKNLIIEPSTREGIDLTDHVDFILEKAYFHPFLIQVICKLLFNEKRTAEENCERIMKEFEIQTEEFFLYLWTHSDLDEKVGLVNLIQNKDIEKNERLKLERRSLLKEKESKIFCPSFEKFISGQIR